MQARERAIGAEAWEQMMEALPMLVGDYGGYRGFVDGDMDIDLDVWFAGADLKFKVEMYDEDGAYTMSDEQWDALDEALMAERRELVREAESEAAWQHDLLTNPLYNC